MIVAPTQQKALPPARHPRDTIPHVCAVCRGNQTVIVPPHARWDERMEAYYPESDERVCPECGGMGWTYV